MNSLKRHFILVAKKTHKSTVFFSKCFNSTYFIKVLMQNQKYVTIFPQFCLANPIFFYLYSKRAFEGKPPSNEITTCFCSTYPQKMQNSHMNCILYGCQLDVYNFFSPYAFTDDDNVDNVVIIDKIYSQAPFYPPKLKQFAWHEKLLSSCHAQLCNTWDEVNTKLRMMKSCIITSLQPGIYTINLKNRLCFSNGTFQQHIFAWFNLKMSLLTFRLCKFFPSRRDFI